MDAIIPPNNTQLLTTEHNRHHKERCSSPEQVQIEGMEARLNTNVNATEGRLVTNQNGIDTRNSVERQGLETRLNVDGRLDTLRSAVDRTSDKTQDDIEKFGFALINEVDKHGHRNEVETRFYGLKNFEATKDSYAAIQLEAAKNHAKAQQDLIETKYQLQLEAQKNTSILAAQIAECCCENKMLIIEKAASTDNLIRKLDENRVRDELSRVYTDLSNLRMRATLPPPLVGATSV